MENIEQLTTILLFMAGLLIFVIGLALLVVAVLFVLDVTQTKHAIRSPAKGIPSASIQACRCFGSHG